MPHETGGVKSFSSPGVKILLRYRVLGAFQVLLRASALRPIGRKLHHPLVRANEIVGFPVAHS